MSRLTEELQNHIHGDMCHEVNETIIALKIHYTPIDNESEDQRKKIIEARNRHPEPSAQKIIDLLSRIHNEMIKCTQPFRRK